MFNRRIYYGKRCFQITRIGKRSKQEVLPAETTEPRKEWYEGYTLVLRNIIPKDRQPRWSIGKARI